MEHCRGLGVGCQKPKAPEKRKEKEERDREKRKTYRFLGIFKEDFGVIRDTILLLGLRPGTVDA